MSSCTQTQGHSSIASFPLYIYTDKKEREGVSSCVCRRIHFVTFFIFVLHFCELGLTVSHLWCELFKWCEWLWNESLHFRIWGVIFITVVNGSALRSKHFREVGMMFSHRRCELIHSCEWLSTEKSVSLWIESDVFTPLMWIFSLVWTTLDWKIYIFVGWVWHFHTWSVNFFTGVNESGLRSLHFRGLNLTFSHMRCEFFS